MKAQIVFENFAFKAIAFGDHLYLINNNGMTADIWPDDKVGFVLQMAPGVIPSPETTEEK